MAYRPGDDACLGFWAVAWGERWCDFPPHAHVLEIGCAEADWQTPMLAERPDLEIVGIDWRACQRPGRMIRGNVLQQAFPHGSFDAIVSISALEHVGLGAYDDDPVDPDGDRRAVVCCAHWLRPAGWLYFDVPYRPRGPYTVGANFRAYDEDELQRRLVRPHFRVAHRRTFTTDHPDSPYVAVHAVKA